MARHKKTKQMFRNVLCFFSGGGLPSLCRGRFFFLAFQGLISFLGVGVGFPSLCEGCLSCSELWLPLASCGWNACCFLLAAGLAFLLWAGGGGLPSLGKRSGLLSPFSAPSKKLNGSVMYRTDVRYVVRCRLQHTILYNCWLVVLCSEWRVRVFLKKKTATVGWVVAHPVRRLYTRFLSAFRRDQCSICSFQWTADLCYRAGKNVSVQCALEQSHDTGMPDVQGKIIDSFQKCSWGHFRAHREAAASG